MKRLLLPLIFCAAMSCSTTGKVGSAPFATIATRLANEPCVSCAADTLRQLLATAPDAQSQMERLQWCERHYGEPTDSLHNERLYMLSLKNATESAFLSNNDKMRYALLLEDATKNALDSTAADFTFITPDGMTHSLHNTATPLTLVYFNDPDCDACQLVKARLDTCQTLREMTLYGTLTVIALYPYPDRELWERTPYPDYIVNGWNEAQDVDGTLYLLPQLPVFYLLDSDKKVLIKNEPSLNRIISAIIGKAQEKP